MATIESIADCPPLPEVKGKIRHCPGWLGYAVTDRGEVWSCRSCSRYGHGWRRLKPAFHIKDNYRSVVLQKDRKGHTVKVCRLVLEAFVSARPHGMEVCHNDGTRTNDHVANLRWDIHIENIRDSMRHGTSICLGFVGSAHPRATVSESDVIMIRYLAAYCSLREIGQLYGVNNCTIATMIQRRSWKHVR